MLKEIDQNTAMDTSSPSPDVAPSTSSNHLALHRTNIFQPHPLGVTCLAASPQRLMLAARRTHIRYKDINSPFSQIDFYDITSKSQPKYVHTIIEYEEITGMAWLDERNLVTVSSESTINVYNIKTASKIKTMTTDFGPITCMKMSVADNLLVTGTKYGYAAVYKIELVAGTVIIELANRMVKIVPEIVSIDFHIRPRTTPVRKKTTAKKPSALLNHAKRKKAESSDESDDGDEANEDDDKPDGKFLEMSDLTIYGGHQDEVSAWDYHKTTIVDVLNVGNNVTALLALKSGNVAVADAAGYLGIIDSVTFTCRQSDQLLQSPILTLATDAKNSSIIAAGEEPTIIILKVDKSSETKDLYVLREGVKDHSGPICCSLFISKKVFFTGSDDNVVIKFRLSRSEEGAKQMKRFYLMPSYKNKLHFNNREAMAIFGKSLQIFKFNPDERIVSEIPSQRSLDEPQRICTVRAGAYVHAACMDDKWICYATSSGVKMIDRPDLSRVDTTASKLPACHIMKLCQLGKYLVLGQQKRLVVVSLEDGSQAEATTESNDQLQTNETDEGVVEKKAKLPVREHKTIFETRLKGVIRDILFYECSNKLVISCGTTNQFLYIIRLPPSTAPGIPMSDKKEDSGFEILFKTILNGRISHLARNVNDASDSNLYLHTATDQIIKCDTSSHTLKKDLTDKLTERDRIKGLPKDVGIQGLTVLSSRECLVHDNNHILKVDIEANEVINSTRDYATILTVDNSVFKKAREILIVSTS